MLLLVLQRIKLYSPKKALAYDGQTEQPAAAQGNSQKSGAHDDDPQSH